MLSHPSTSSHHIASLLHQMLGRRLQLLAENCLSTFTTTSETSKHVTEQMGEWIKKRYQAECSAVYALDQVVKEAALQGELTIWLEYQLIII